MLLPTDAYVSLGNAWAVPAAGTFQMMSAAPPVATTDADTESPLPGDPMIIQAPARLLPFTMVPLVAAEAAMSALPVNVTGVPSGSPPMPWSARIGNGCRCGWP